VTLLQEKLEDNLEELHVDNLAELHVPIRSGNTPRTKHTHTIRNHLNAVFAHPNVGRYWDQQAGTPYAPTLHTAWRKTRRATTKHRVHLAATQQTINRIEQ